MSLASIDKLVLSLPESEFQIRTLSDKLSLAPAHRPLNAIDTEPGWLTSCADGSEIRGSKVYANHDLANITIGRIPTGALYMKLSVNPNKFHHSWQPSTDSDKYCRFRGELESIVSDFGIDCNLPASQISRLDLAKQKKLSHPLKSYHPVFDAINAKRQDTRKYEDSVLIRNTQRQTAIYDKQKEANLPSIYMNLVRCENRFLTSETVQKYTGLRTLSDLDKNIKSDGFNHLNDVYTGYLDTEIFTVSKTNQVLGLTMQEHIQSIATESPNKVRTIYIQERGIFDAVREAGGVDSFAEILTSTKSFTNDESRKRYFRRQRAELLSTIDRVVSRPSESNREFVSLLDELVSGFINETDQTPMSKIA